MEFPLLVRDLRVTGPSGRVLLSVGSLDIPAGSVIGVRGPSGAGKSTLLYALGGLLPATGSVRWGDVELLEMPVAHRTAFRAANIGMIFQDFLLFEELGSAENAGLAAMFAPRQRRAAVREAAADTLHHLGLTPGTRSVASFSGGERQRVGVARALAADAAILLADEPTASLHREAADALIDDLVGMARDKTRTLIAVSHDLHLLDRMDRVLWIEDGILQDSVHDAA
ncbi:MAG: ATP-binding cassette domain-containing protein [Rhodobacteraceae bacterium]|nr:ATP-binding cassette domain-containing protein [Alphaproteobacteria bacterium]NNK68004.1 ATP-binding cassette domain-containing protein [Paracoccaceae bacterium]